MPDFTFLKNSITGHWVISAPRRAGRPNELKGTEPKCPFCVGREKEEQELFRIGGEKGDESWKVRVVSNKYPFAPIHEVIIHSPDHRKNFDELPLSQTELVIQAYRQRFSVHREKGQVYIFQNHGEASGESLPHPHSQLAVIPNEVEIDTPPLAVEDTEKFQETPEFIIFCPQTSEWPDEVWIRPKSRGRMFFEITDTQIEDFSKVLHRIIQIFDLRHGSNFPFNFYIYPGGDWYLRIMPRLKINGGFELGTGVAINTQDPNETIEFIKTHFESPDIERIKNEHKAQYRRSV